MGEVIRFPVPEQTDEGALAFDTGDVPAACLALFRLLTRDFESGARVPENLFLVYGAHTPAKGRSPSSRDTKGRSPSSREEGSMTWSYLALNLTPQQLAAAVKRVIKDLKKNPNPPSPGCA